MEEEISKEEFALADELKGFCTAYGREREETLSGSADVLMRMGQLYLSKASKATSQKMSQKFSFIRCAALLHGAIVRFSKTKNSNKISEVMAVLENLDKNLKMACSFMKLRGKLDLSEKSEKIKKQLIGMREEKEKTLKNLPKIPDDIDQKLAYVMEEAKISIIRKLLEESTKDYKNLMCQIAEKCVELLGEPPCKFALVGLGSMAREEITLYSDFEHVIVLEEEVQDLQNYEDVQEYFRWYAVMFQIIVVGLGETFIRSVGVPSISDLNTDDKATNWYFDVWTPCGVAFDGMVPHACHNPLGRHYTTKMGKPPHELIQPAGKMAQYLCSDEHIKNGYYLKDVLSKTCFVFGNSEVYKCFQSFSETIFSEVSFQDIIEEQESLIQRNYNINVRAGTIVDPSLKQDIKFILYRPLSALLACAAKIFGLKPHASCLSIVDEMFREKIINQMALHDLLNAFVVACELRLDAYSIVGHQRSQVAYSKLTEFVGKRSAVDCCTVTGNLRELVSSLIRFIRDKGLSCDEARNKMMSFKFNFRHGFICGYKRASALYSLGYSEEAVVLAKKVLQMKSNHHKGYIHLFVAHAHFQLGTVMGRSFSKEAKPPRKVEAKIHEHHLDQAKTSYEDALETASLTEPDMTQCYQIIAKILRMRERYQEGLDFINEHLKKGCIDENEQVKRQRFYRCFEMQFNKELMEANEYERYVSERLCQEKEIHVKLFLQLEMVDIYLKSGKKDEARKLLTQAADTTQENGKLLVQDLVLNMLWDMIKIQCEQRWTDELRKTLAFLHDMPEKGGKMKSMLQEQGLFDHEDCRRALINCYLEEAGFTAPHKARMLLIKKAIDLCKSSAGKECLEERYAFAIECQLRVADSKRDFNEVMRTFAAAPLQVQRHEHLLSTSYSWVHKQFRIFELEGMSGTYDHETTMRLISILEVYSEHMVQPIIGYLFLTLRRCDVIKKDEASMKALDDLRLRMVEKYHICMEGHAAQMYNLAVECFAASNCIECAAILWKLLNGRYGDGRFIKRFSVTLFLSLVTVSMQKYYCYYLVVKNQYLCVAKHPEGFEYKPETDDWHRGLCKSHHMFRISAETNRYNWMMAAALLKTLKEHAKLMVHPVIGYKYTSLMKYPAIQQDHCVMDLLVNVKPRMIARLIIHGRGSDVSSYNEAVRCYADFDITGCASKLWEVLTKVSPEASCVGRAAFELLLCLLVVSLDISNGGFD